MPLENNSELKRQVIVDSRENGISYTLFRNAIGKKLVAHHTILLRRENVRAEIQVVAIVIDQLDWQHGPASLSRSISEGKRNGMLLDGNCVDRQRFELGRTGGLLTLSQRELPSERNSYPNPKRKCWSHCRVRRPVGDSRRFVLLLVRTA